VVVRYVGLGEAERPERIVHRVRERRHAATFGLSPTPFAPIGWCGDGVVVQSVVQCGVSTAVGRKKSISVPVITLPISS
jgi:hypothetical protein